MKESEANTTVVFQSSKMRELEIDVKGQRLVIYETKDGRTMFRVNEEACPLMAFGKGIEHFFSAL